MNTKGKDSINHFKVISNRLSNVLLVVGNWNSWETEQTLQVLFEYSFEFWGN